MSEPVRFCFGVHIHQPVGNFDSVFAQHVEEAYRPFLERCAVRGFAPVALHVSGPLIEWLEAHDPAFLELVVRLVGERRLELLLAGFYEPVLAALPRRDRIEQIEWMREALLRRFGVEASGLWLTERVWEPDLAADLARAGVRFALVDDRHFLVTGMRREQLHQPWTTEHDGGAVTLFPIDERLRYLVPFRPPEETVAYFESLSQAGHALAVLADDGEKFGGWPGTREWVYERGWLDRFFDAFEAAREAGLVRLSTFAEALEQVPSGGLAYLPTASYRELEAWALPPEAGRRLAAVERELGPKRLEGAEGALVRGAHWRNFLAKYPEANRMHKKMVAVSALCRRRGDPPAARRAVGRSQCNDAYWHGVFGGLYLPHLRAAVWRNLALAEAELRSGEGLEAEVLDLDADGHPEIWVHSSRFSALVSPRHGGSVVELTRFAEAVNYADVLTRRREAYHEIAPDNPVRAESAGEASSIHEPGPSRLSALPPVDVEPRALFQERVLEEATAASDYAARSYRPVLSWANAGFTSRLEPQGQDLVVTLEAEGLTKRLRFADDGTLTVSYAWSAGTLPEGSWFTTELSLSQPLSLSSEPLAQEWRYSIATVSKSERGFEECRQGDSVTLRWPSRLGAASVRLAHAAP
jgi:alpha-amylase